jgi:hypothetical protein
MNGPSKFHSIIHPTKWKHPKNEQETLCEECGEDKRETYCTSCSKYFCEEGKKKHHIKTSLKDVILEEEITNQKCCHHTCKNQVQDFAPRVALMNAKNVGTIPTKTKIQRITKN